MQNIKDTVKRLISENSNRLIDVNDINNNTMLLDDLDYDSICFVNLIVAIEEVFKIDFDENYMILDRINNFNDLVNYLESKMNVDKGNTNE